MKIISVLVFFFCGLGLASANVEVVKHSSNYDAPNGLSDEEQSRVSTEALNTLSEKCGSRKMDVIQFDVFPMTLMDNATGSEHQYQIRSKALCY